MKTGIVFLSEKRTLAYLFVILAYYMLVKISQFSIEYQSIITALFWLLLSVYVYFSEKVRNHSKIKHREFYIMLMLVCAVLYIISYFVIGTIDGFGVNIYNTSLLGVTKNILTLGSVIVFREWIRTYLINAVQKRFAIIFGLLIILVFSFSEINVSAFRQLSTAEDWLSYISKNVLPVIFFNVFLTYAAYIMGFYGPLIYAVVTRVPIWVVRILPNFRWITLLLVGTLLPLLFTIILKSISKRKIVRGKRQEIKQENPASWIATAVIAIVTVWFALGIFPIFPTAIISNSMKPQISKGDMVLIKKIDIDTLVEQDVILYQLEDIQVFHRIIEIQYNEGVKQFITKGDNNNARDPNPVLYEQVIGKHVLTVPYIGWPGMLLKQNVDESRIEQGQPQESFIEKLAQKYVEKQLDEARSEKEK